MEGVGVEDVCGPQYCNVSSNLQIGPMARANAKREATEKAYANSQTGGAGAAAASSASFSARTLGKRSTERSYSSSGRLG